MTISDQDIESELEFTKELMDDAFEDLEQGTVPSNRIPLTYKSVARDARDLGGYQLALGNHEAASDWFEQSAMYYLKGINMGRNLRQSAMTPEEGYWENEPRNLRDAFYAALLSRSKTAITKTVEEILAMDASFVTEYPEATPWYYYTKTLATTFSGEPQAVDYLADLKAHKERADASVVPFFDAVITILEGILSTDTESTQEGLERLQGQYCDEVGKEPSTASEMVDIETAALLRLVQSKGIEVTMEYKYVPEILFKE